MEPEVLGTFGMNFWACSALAKRAYNYHGEAFFSEEDPETDVPYLWDIITHTPPQASLAVQSSPYGMWTRRS